VAFIRDDPILVWAARECSKPARHCGEGVAERWLLQARASWSNNFAQLLPDEAGRWMQRAFAARLARPLAQKSCMAVRWPYATPVGFLPEAFLWDPARTIGVTGDWCGGASVESAFLSGLSIVQAISAS
jgi:renalase